MRQLLEITPLPGYPEDIGRWLWAMEAVREENLEVVGGLTQEELDWEGLDGQENSIGSLLYHIAGVEMGWLHFDLLQLKEFPPEVKEDFPHDLFGADRLTAIKGVPLAEHLGRLERSRAVFLDAFRGMTLEDWRSLRAPDGENYEVTPEWTVFHLVEHEAGHAYQIRSLKRRAAHALRQ
ncbi:DinB family protein [Alicyclobacillus sp. ALC3]|uniref:DinB family protein n=1 Tax=Alicyclobacillus sp. ALC3 TaxID=2796143 RepID=UPI002379FE7F|nr:DinB family protein [Alicyclobacillus sp. ALC3]WDL95371.1 DinB family protein [Alicyclobacillus sp. ALC3]